MTASAPLFDLADIQDISGETYEEPEKTQVERFIAIASAKLRSRVSNLDERIADGRLDPVLVTGTGAAMVLRALTKMRRGIGVTRTEYPEVSEQYSADSRAGLVYVTTEELNDLLDTPDDGSDAFTIRTGR
ncbi:hypothetical protein [Nocardia africana]|uniref:Uncharacterized protein n=1 Tax=Nocardia africana TaxID=134964 RepID=A0A378X3U7_9NOCA|nr:hypothetical protein [Nocardia africana]MCC3311525.1 phage Gp19/Gp15/Gp42 family protein [Nocardia africana]SUA47213.1 Uncharacterised protein [Nocardia africana]